MLIVRQVRPSDVEQLSVFFKSISADPTAELFHPHEFDERQAELICRYEGIDMYLIGFYNRELGCYGMLRGWDEGYSIPALGIYVAPKFRGIGVAEEFMLELQRLARFRGASQLMVKVYPDNTKARKLYEKLGYVFSSTLDNQQRGLLDL
jgi:ribosomal protein S18 acetylase RimI-like enzyme